MNTVKTMIPVVVVGEEGMDNSRDQTFMTHTRNRDMYITLCND